MTFCFKYAKINLGAVPTERAASAALSRTKGRIMEPLRRKTLAGRATIAASVAATLIVGTLFPSGNSSRSASESVRAEASAAVAASVKSDESEMVEFIEYRKAGIDEYEMPAAVTSVPVKKAAVEATAGNKTEQKAQAPAANISDQTASQPSYSGNFTVSNPGGTGSSLDPQPVKLTYGKTRSVANEYYTVKDLRVGGALVTMDAHRLVCMMVCNEIGDKWNEEAIKAQAVAAYSNLRFCEAIGATPTVGLYRNYTPIIEKCVSAVEGQCVYYNGGIANTAYSASSAGYSCDSKSVFGVDYPYLKSVVSAYDAEDPNYGVVTKFTESYIRNTLQSRLGIVLSGNVQNWFSIASVSSGKYVNTLVIDGGKAKMSGPAARKLFGLKSAAFEISYSNGMFYFKTYGFGHGVGMSQWGAKLYADHGYSYDQILRHYYVNTTVQVSEPSITALRRGGMSTAQLETQIKQSSVALAQSTGADPSNDITVDKSSGQTASAPQQAAAANTEPEQQTPVDPAEPAVTADNTTVAGSDAASAETAEQSSLTVE